MNTMKTKILTTDSDYNGMAAPFLVETRAGFVEVARDGESHKYLGKLLTGNPRQRGRCNLLHRISVGWLKFHNHQQTLTNKKIPLKLRLRLLDAVVTPAVLYSLSSTPLTEACLTKLDAAQRKMLRKLLGWQNNVDETWAEAGSRMKGRFQDMMTRFHIKIWSATLRSQKQKLTEELSQHRRSALASLSCSWKPASLESLTANGVLGYRGRGRPTTRWHDICSHD